MELRSARLTGDSVLRDCLNGNHRMLFGEDGLPVMRVQSALLDLGRSVGPKGADGFFGAETAKAITEYKTFKGLAPNDPVVGPGTALALDTDLFLDPPALDPTFAEFGPAVIEHRLEQFVALELLALLRAPLGSWRHMLGSFALSALNSGQLLGIVAQSRAKRDLFARFLDVADPVQPDGKTPKDFFDKSIKDNGNSLAVTVVFLAGGQLRSFIVIFDRVILGRGVITRTSDNTHAFASLLGTICHELTHARNLANIQALVDTPDTDTDAYADTALAQARSATGKPTSQVLHNYVAELTARHVHWVILKELAGIPGGMAVLALPADQLVAAALLYFRELRRIYDSNGYGAAIDAQGEAIRFRQLALWLNLCADQSFSDLPADDNQSKLAFQAAAQLCADPDATSTLDFADADGVFPLIRDFE